MDLLRPPELTDHYIHQLRQTIHAYSPTQVVLGEALQNAIDAVVESAEDGPHVIEIRLDFDDRSITVRDDGTGFPNEPALLYLGGSRKRIPSKKVFGLVGVGIKVVLFRSEFFSIRSRTADGNFSYTVTDACRFENDPPPGLEVPDAFAPDPDPLPQQGTEVHYRFPTGTTDDVLSSFTEEVRRRSISNGLDSGFARTVSRAVEQERFDTRLSALLAAYLRRFTYAADVLNRVGGKPELQSTRIRVEVIANDAQLVADPLLRELLDGRSAATFELRPEYLIAEDVREWLPSQERFGLFSHDLGPGGTNLVRTANGINVLLLTGPQDYEQLLLDRHGQIPAAVNPNIDEYRTRLFNRINGILLTIGRIPRLEETLPGGSRRVLSANGVVTTHDLDFSRGRNQAYIRCLDLVLDLDAQLNYGKSQLTDLHLVNRVRRFVNDAYSATLENAAGGFVGKIRTDDDDEFDVFLGRHDLELGDLVVKKEPRDENDVIALFFELAGRQMITGYRFYGLSQKDRYDGRATIRRSGDAQEPVTPTDDRQLNVVEFKVVASSILPEFEREAKQARDIRLLIAWSEGIADSNRFAFGDILYSTHHPNKVFPGVTRYLHDTVTGAEVQILLLKDLVEQFAGDAGARGDEGS